MGVAMPAAFRALIFGAPGSGKGTIAARIEAALRLKHVSSGDLLRAEIAADSACGRAAQRHVEAGELVPDTLMIELIQSRIGGGGGWLLDGFPRTVHQARHLQQVCRPDVVLVLDVPSRVIIDRVRHRWIHPGSGRVYNVQFEPPRQPFVDDVTGEQLVQRPDDAPEAVRRRLELYRHYSEPIIYFYHTLGCCRHFAGSETNQIWPHVHKCLVDMISQRSSD